MASKPFRIEQYPDAASLTAKPAAGNAQPGSAAGQAEQRHSAERERDALSAMVQLARAQAAALLARPADRVHLASMGGELAGVWKETETATFTILDAADQLSRALRLSATRLGGVDREAIAGISEAAIIRILEACAFNDLGGQRIARLVEAITLIEKQVQRLGQVLGGADRLAPFVELAEQRLTEQRGTEGSFGLAQGPALAQTGATADQDQIDRLFGPPPER